MNRDSVRYWACWLAAWVGAFYLSLYTLQFFLNGFKEGFTPTKIGGAVAASFLTLTAWLNVAYGWWRPIGKKLPGCCPNCDYDLTGNTSGICPECGTAIR
jgi:CHASE2 domain-containing sensor protein